MAININGGHKNVIEVQAETNQSTEQNNETAIISLEKTAEIRDEQQTMLSVRDKVKTRLIETGKMDILTSQIDITDNNSIIEFGKEPAEYMSGVADKVLSQYSSKNIDGTAKLVDALVKLMGRIDIDEIKSLEDIKKDSKKRGLFSRLKESASEKLDRLVGKYRGIGSEMEIICTQLRVYEEDIKRSNSVINQMFEASMQKYTQLQEYIVAGEQALIEIDEYKRQVENDSDPTDQETMFKIRDIENKRALMEKRLLDLRGSEAISLQAIPTFKVQEYTNSNLARKINSAFIETIPAFKTALVTCVIAKQQMIESQGLAILDDATSAFLEKAANNTVMALKTSQELANRSAISADTVEKTWEILLNGIKEYKANEIEYSKTRAEEIKRMDDANARYIDAVKNGTVM